MSSYAFNNSQWAAFICGIIDGDGCIRNKHLRIDSYASIELHCSWQFALKIILDKISTITSVNSATTVKVSKRGYAVAGT